MPHVASIVSSGNHPVVDEPYYHQLSLFPPNDFDPKSTALEQQEDDTTRHLATVESLGSSALKNLAPNLDTVLTEAQRHTPEYRPPVK